MFNTGYERKGLFKLPHSTCIKWVYHADGQHLTLPCASAQVGASLMKRFDWHTEVLSICRCKEASISQRRVPNQDALILLPLSRSTCSAYGSWWVCTICKLCQRSLGQYRWQFRLLHSFTVSSNNHTCASCSSCVPAIHLSCMQVWLVSRFEVANYQPQHDFQKRRHAAHP